MAIDAVATGAAAIVQEHDAAFNASWQALGHPPPSDELNPGDTDGIYKHTLAGLGLPIDGLEGPALKAAFWAVVKGRKGTRAPGTVAQDSAAVAGFATRFPNAGPARTV
jgi:hypothetical protein